MRTFLRFAVPALTMTLCTEVYAATANTISGEVFVNAGGGFNKILNTQPVKPGDQVMAGKNGSGEIVYDDGCRVTVDPGQVVAVAEDSGCHAGFLPAGHDALGIAIVGVAGAGAVWAIVDSGSGSSSP